MNGITNDNNNPPPRFPRRALLMEDQNRSFMAAEALSQPSATMIQKIPFQRTEPRTMKSSTALRFKLFFPLGLLAYTALSQSIIAGQYGPNDHFGDLLPDTTITIYAFSTPGNYAMDLDGDGDDDVRFSGSVTASPSGHLNYVYATCLGTTEVAQGEVQCGDTSALGYQEGQTIDGTADWSSSLAQLTHDFALMGQSCAFNSFSGGRYLGTRLINEQDTLYGWVHVSTPAPNTFTLQALAINNTVNSIQSNNAFNDRFFFDPLRHELTITLSTPSSGPHRIDVYDMSGRSVTSEFCPKGSDMIMIAMNDLPEGVYAFASAGANGRTLNGRVLITR